MSGLPEQMTVLDAARVLGVAHQTIRKRIEAGHMRAVKIGRDWLIDRAEVEAWRERGYLRDTRPEKRSPPPTPTP